MQVSIEVQGLTQAQSTLKTLQQKGEDTAPLMAELANHLYNVVDESFEKQQTPDGISWEPIQARRGDQTPDKILRDEGTMQDSLSSEHSSDEAIVGLNATANGYPYPIVHQFGREDGTIEARAFIPIHEDGTLYNETKQEIEEILEDYMEDVLK
jgi:phage virion morphogenesis protein